MCPPSPATAEHHRHYPGDLHQPLCDVFHCRIIHKRRFDHTPIFPQLSCPFSGRHFGGPPNKLRDRLSDQKEHRDGSLTTIGFIILNVTDRLPHLVKAGPRHRVTDWAIGRAFRFLRQVRGKTQTYQRLSLSGIADLDLIKEELIAGPADNTGTGRLRASRLTP